VWSPDSAAGSGYSICRAQEDAAINGQMLGFVGREPKIAEHIAGRGLDLQAAPLIALRSE
jgi:hypothetical protein